MWRLIARLWGADAVQREDAFILPDGQVYVVPRGNLVAAKDLLAAQKAAARRVAAWRGASLPEAGDAVGRPQPTAG